MAIGMVFIGGLGGEGEAEQDEAGGKNIGGGFQAVRDHGSRMPGKPGGDLDQRQRAADHHSGDRDALADLHERKGRPRTGPVI